MEFQKSPEPNTDGLKITALENGEVVGWIYLYLLRNDAHREPFGFLENLFVLELHRNQGIGSRLLEAAIKEAKARGCYKLVGTSRFSNERAPKFYKRFGFAEWGTEFRLDF